MNASIPDTLILDCSSQLKVLRRVFSDLDTPIIDYDATMQRIFDTVIVLSNVQNELTFVASDMANGEELFENLEQSGDAYGRVFAAVMAIGFDIKDQLLALGAYHHGQFPYAFRGLNHDDSIVLSKFSANV